ncbi:MAG: CBS domain-containing protein [Pseudonocardia sp.]
MKVSTLLQKKGSHVHTIHPAATIATAADALAGSSIGALVVTDVVGEVVGMLSERDLVRGMHVHGGAVVALTVADLMTRRVEVCAPEDTVNDLMRRMTVGRFRHMPVVEDGHLAGLVSIGDVVKSRIEEVELESGVLRDCYLASR